MKGFATKITGRALIIFILAAAFYLFEFIIQVSPGVMAGDLMRDFAINATRLGMMSGVFYYSYTAMQLPAGILFDRFNSRWLMALVIVLFACGTLVFSLAPTVHVAALGRFIMGGAAAFAFIGVLHLTIRWFPPQYFAMFVGVAELMGSLGAMVGSAPLALMLEHYSWRETGVIFAIAGLVLAALVFLVIRDRKIHEDHAHAWQEPLLNSLKTIFTNSQTWAIGLYSFMIWAPVLAFSALWGVSFLMVSCKLTKVEAATAIAITWLGVALASPIVGWLSDRITNRKFFLILSAFFGIIAITIVIFVANLPIDILYLLMFLIGFASAGQTISFAVIKDNNSPATNSTANGFNNMVVVAGGILFQPLIGKFLDLSWHGAMFHGIRIYDLHAYRMAFLILPICYLIAFITSLFWVKETHCKAMWQTEDRQR